MKLNKDSLTARLPALLWTAAGLLALGTLFSSILWGDKLWIASVLGGLLLVVLAALFWRNRQQLSGRSTRFGLYSLTTVILVLGIVGTVNFLGNRYQKKWDLTKNQLHTFSDQTTQTVKSLDQNLTAVLFTDIEGRERLRPLLDQMKAVNPKITVEYVDPTSNPSRAKQAGIKRMNTLWIEYGERNSRIEDPTEEKVTNELIKIARKDSYMVCNIEGHAERSLESKEADGISGVKEGLEGLAYKTKTVQLAQEGKVPPDCTTLIVAGSSKGFLPQEIKLLSDYLDRGGRMVLALDLNVEGKEFTPELIALSQKWAVNAKPALIVDPLSKLLGVDAAVPIIPQFDTTHAITKDFKKDVRNANCFFPFTRPLETTKEIPAGLTATAIAQTSPQSWAEFDLKSLASGRVKFDDGADQKGPVAVAIAVSGKKEGTTAIQETRLVVFGTSLFAANNYARLGLNQDLFLNAVSWTLADDKNISIRTKEDDPGKVELTQEAGLIIFWVSVVLAPMAFIVLGIVVWVRRRKL